METMNKVFIATSIDGYIADREGGLDWLHSIPNPEQLDMGYNEFINGVDAILMGRTTFETVCGFDCPWPYTKPVFVLSKTLNEMPEAYQDKVQLIQGDLYEVIKQINDKGYRRLYIDGGRTIQSFLREDMIDELTVTTIPVILGGGSPLFGHTEAALGFELISTQVFLDNIIQSHYRRKR